MKFQTVVTTASAMLLLAACGGGGGGGDRPSAPANPPANATPVVNAGADMTIELPAKATLQGSATDSDTAASSLTYSWTGPTDVTFSAAGSATTDATFASAGSFTLTLSVSDGNSTGTDTVVVTVNAAAFPAPGGTAGGDDGWQRFPTPADAGMDATKLQQAADYAQSNPRAGPGNGMVVRHGKIVFSWGDIDFQRGMQMKSVTKSMGGAALGLAIDDAKLALTDKAIDRMPTFGVPPDANAATGWLPMITISQLATHTAGFEKPGGFCNLQSQPGTQWFYSDCGLNWLADVLTETFNEDLSTLVTRRVWTPLGLTGHDVFWRPNSFRTAPRPTGLTYRELASGLDANVNAMARVGLLFLRKGMWNDQRIVSEDFVNTVHTPRPENAALQSPPGFPNATNDYGVLWWTNKSGQMTTVPTDAFWAWGLGETLIVVIPSLDLVIARNGGQDTTVSAGRVWNDANWDGDVAVLEPFIGPIAQSVTP